MTRPAEPDWQPTLIGDSVLLRPLVADDFEACHQAASSPTTWAQHPDAQRYRADIFRTRFFDTAAASSSAFVIVNRADEQVIGSTRYYDWDAGHREVAIGYTFIAHEFWGTGVNTQIKRLMLDHVFQWVDVVWFHVAGSNERSRRAVQKLGAHPVRKELRTLDDQIFEQWYYRLTHSGWRSNHPAVTH